MNRLFVFFILFGLSSACSYESEEKIQKDSGVEVLEKSLEPVKIIEANKRKPLDLDVTDEMVIQHEKTSQDINGWKKNTPTNASLPETESLLDLKQKSDEKRVKLKGEVFYDGNNQDYIEAIEGGKVDVEIKFAE